MGRRGAASAAVGASHGIGGAVHGVAAHRLAERSAHELYVDTQVDIATGAEANSSAQQSREAASLTQPMDHMAAGPREMHVVQCWSRQSVSGWAARAVPGWATTAGAASVGIHRETHPT